MSRPVTRMIAVSIASGVCAGAVVNGAWLLLTDKTPSLWTALALTQGLVALWSIGQAVRFRRKWLSVLESYNRPALGEGIETPNRPPADEETPGDA